jgi:ribonucleoside-diphosphate reductase alpha chain
MMGATQPFISGAISKTVNVPKDATIDDITEAYIQSWKLGAKAISIYRDGSKRTQPLNTSKDKTAAEIAQLAAAQLVTRPVRHKLPDERKALTHKFDIQGHEGYVTVGFYPDGRPGEVFITMAKEGSTIGGLMDVLGTSISIGLQYGVSLEVFVNKFAHSRFEPAGFTKNPDIPIAKSVPDYIFRWLGMEFIPGYREANAPQRSPEEPPATRPPVIKVNGHRTATIADLDHAEAVMVTRNDPPAPAALPPLLEGLGGQEKQFAHFQSDAPSCDNCGALTVRCGTCYRCFNCGNSMGCS